MNPSVEKHSSSSKKPPSEAGSGTTPAKPAQTQGEAREPAKIKGCPTGMRKSRCAEVGAAYEKQKGSGSSHVVEPGECPRALSDSECRKAGAAYQEAPEQGHIVGTNECPRAMTEAQCAEAGKAYAEALK